MEADLCAHLGARANIDTNDDAPTVYLPLMDFEGKILPVHFLQLSEVSIVDWQLLLLSLSCSCFSWSGVQCQFIRFMLTVLLTGIVK